MKLPNQTLVGIAQPNTADITKQLLMEMRLGQLTKAPSPTHITRYMVGASNCDQFLIDIVTTIDNQLCVFTDVRPFLTSEMKIKRLAQRDYTLRDIHSKLLALWLDNREDLFLTDLAFAGSVFVTAISMRLTHIYQLDGEQQIILALLLAQYYGQNIRSEVEYTEQQAIRDMTIYSGLNVSRLNNNIVTYCVIPRQTSLTNLLETIKTKLASPKTTNLSLAAFLIAIKPLVFVYRQDAIIPFAIEFVPMFVALVYLASTDRTMQKSYLFNAVTSNLTRNKQQHTTMFETMKKLEMGSVYEQE